MLKQKDKKADYWGGFAGRYDEGLEHAFGTGLRANLALILENEHARGNVVEFGCGTGYFTRAVAKSAGHVTATDLSPRMIEVAKVRQKDLHNVTFKVQDSEDTSLPSDTYDTALMANMLHTLNDPLRALKECYRVLKKGSTLLIINYTGEGMRRVDKVLLFFRFALNFGMPPRGYWPITMGELRSFLISAGFKVERMELIKGKINAIYSRAKKD